MDSRIIKTKFWQDEKIQSLTLEARLLFIYLITCPYIGKTGVFEITDSYILLETGLNKKQLTEAKGELERKKRVFFFNNWVYIVNALKHMRYDVGPKSSVGFRKELENLPKNIIDYIDNLNDGSIGEYDGSIAEYIKNKTQRTKNKTQDITYKTQDIKEEEKEETLSEEELDKVIEKIKL